MKFFGTLCSLICCVLLTAAAAAKSLQSCLSLCNPRDGSPPGSSVPGILQARTLEWVAIAFSYVLLTRWSEIKRETSESRKRSWLERKDATSGPLPLPNGWFIPKPGSPYHIRTFLNVWQIQGDKTHCFFFLLLSFNLMEKEFIEYFSLFN